MAQLAVLYTFGFTELALVASPADAPVSPLCRGRALPLLTPETEVHSSWTIKRKEIKSGALRICKRRRKEWCCGSAREGEKSGVADLQEREKRAVLRICMRGRKERCCGSAGKGEKIGVADLQEREKRAELRICKRGRKESCCGSAREGEKRGVADLQER
jgi:hypothetical protein